MREKAMKRDVVPKLKIECVCGVSYFESRKDIHFQGQKHKMYMETHGDEEDEFLLIEDDDSEVIDSETIESETLAALEEL